VKLAQIKPCVETISQQTYVEAIQALKQHNVPFALGGAFAVWYYTGHWRNTHDMDAFAEPFHVDSGAEALMLAGFTDLGEQAAGDRGWIYHAVKGDIIVDIIFMFANRISSVTSYWIDNAKQGELFGEQVKFIPIEELVWSKIFTLNRHRCDWPDVIRIIRADCEGFDWDHLLEKVGDAWMLLASVVNVFDWQHPADYQCIPMNVRQELNRRREDYRPDPNAPSREKLLDPWIHSRPEDTCYWEQ
jgi:hypothetical protein